MSGPLRAHPEDKDDPSLDDGVLAPCPLIEFNGYRAVQRHGGCAVLPWRSDHLHAQAAGIRSMPFAGQGGAGAARFPQALVRVQKGRGLTYRDLVWAWQALEADGRLLVTGHNDLGITAWSKRIGRSCANLEILANHSHARVVVVTRPLACPQPWMDESGAGLFNGGMVDAGSALLLTHLPYEPVPQRVLDLGCGAGHLGLAAMQQWSDAQVCFVDADARAVEAVRAILAPRSATAGMPVHWWDASEALPESGFDLVLCNPPCHAGTQPDLVSARLMFQAAAGALRPGGRLLVVANRNLPYETDLSRLGMLSRVDQAHGFKVLAVVTHG
jgi:16S rRNA (guanine1207-N2)-methyltransferase